MKTRSLIVAAAVLLSHFVGIQPTVAQTIAFDKAQQRGFQGLDVETEGKWQGPFFFIQMADTQYGMFSKNKGFEKEADLVSQAVGHINRLKPRFVIVCGDLTHATPKETQYGDQVQQFKRDFSKVSADIPLVCVCGNHDIGNRPNASSIAKYRQHFGDDYFSFWVGGVHNLVLNSTVIKDSTDAEDILKRQDDWFRETLQQSKRDGAVHSFVFQHHPWFLKAADEPDLYFNLPIERRRKALAMMHEAGVRAVFAGHYHRNAYAKDGELEMITTGPVGKPLGKDPSGFRAVRVFHDQIDHAYYSLKEVPDSISLDPKSAGRKR